MALQTRTSTSGWQMLVLGPRPWCCCFGRSILMFCIFIEDTKREQPDILTVCVAVQLGC